MGKDEMKLDDRLATEVRNARGQNKKLGAKRLKAIKVDHPKDDATTVLPRAPEGMMVRKALFDIQEANKDSLKSRQAMVDELEFLTDPNEAEVNCVLHHALRLNTKNPKQNGDLMAIMCWVKEFKIEEKCAAAVEVCQDHFNDGLCCLRKSSIKMYPCKWDWMQRHADKICLIWGGSDFEELMSCPRDALHLTSDALVRVTAGKLGKLLMLKDLAGIILARIQTAMKHHADLYLSGGTVSKSASMSCQSGFRDEISTFKGYDSLVGEFPVSPL